MSQTDAKVLGRTNLAKKREAELAALFVLTDRLYRARNADDIYKASLDAITDTLNSNRASIENWLGTAECETISRVRSRLCSQFVAAMCF